MPPNTSGMRGHGYATVDDRLVWGVVERDVVTLLNAIGRLLAAAEK